MKPIKKILNTIKTLILRDEFNPRPLSFVLYPSYIIRSRLYKHVSSMADRIQGNVLDLGCGSKPYEHLFTKSSNYIGVDIKTSGHDHKGSNIDCFYDGTILPFRDNTFDSVVTFEVFEHIFNPDVVLAEISRVLKKDGVFLLTVPFAWEEHEVPYDYARYTSYGIAYLLTKNGFNVLDVKKTTSSLLAIFQLLINHISSSICTKNKLVNALIRIIIIPPLATLFFILDKAFPKSDKIFCNCIVLAVNINK